MSRVRRSLAPILPLLLAACATQTPRTAPVTVALEQSRISFAETIDVTPGDVTAVGAVGGATGVRDAWFRFRVDRPGRVRLTLDVQGSDDLLSLSLYDAGNAGDPSAKPFESLLTRSDDKAIETPVAPGLYHVKVATSAFGDLAEFDLALTFLPAPPAAAAEDPLPDESEEAEEATPPRVARIQRPPAPRAQQPRPGPAPSPAKPIVPAPAPQPVPAPAPVPPSPPPLAEPSRSTANRLLGEAHVVVPIGAGNGVRWQWFEIDLLRRGRVILDFTSDAPVHAMLAAENGNAVGHVSIQGTAVHDAYHGRGKLYLRVGPSASDTAARVTIRVKIVIAGSIHRRP